MMADEYKKVLFKSIKHRIWTRLQSWEPTLFSQDGKKILLKAVIQAMPMYFMSCFRISEGQCQEIEKYILCI